MESNIKGESNLGWIDARSFLCLAKYLHALRFFSLLLVFLYCMLERLKTVLVTKVVLPLSPMPEWKWWCGAAYDVGDHFLVSNAGASGVWKWMLHKLSTQGGGFSSPSTWSTLHLFLSHNQTKLRIIIAVMCQEGLARRWEHRVPAEFSWWSYYCKIASKTSVKVPGEPVKDATLQ